MLALERKTLILRYLETNGKAEIKELSAAMGVVPETIRRDLKELEAKGLLNRTHGGALREDHSAREHPLNLRETEHRAEKELLCERAASCIKDNDTIFLDNSSTLIRLVDFIPRKLRVTILTNSLRVLLQYAKSSHEGITMIGTGGVFNRNNLSLSGTIPGKNSFNFFPDKAFVSCHGVSLEFGFTDGNLLELGFKQEMITTAKETYFLVDHSKFGKRGPFPLATLENCDVLVTDAGSEDETLQGILAARPGMRILPACTEKGACM